MNGEELKKELEVILNLIPANFSEVRIEAVDGGTLLNVESSDSSILIGREGETLMAINHLFRRMQEKKNAATPHSVAVDVNGYRKKSEERIRGTARMLGERAVMFKHEVEMEPMGAYERRIVHSVFQDHPNIVTESQGEKNYRRVVIKYVECKTNNAQSDNFVKLDL
ncbi:MAG: R3H domain-containing nucleic acid-binding protein [bacterium]|nr:R3H domain-containing nucleic acid-binding protein [bacterium]